MNLLIPLYLVVAAGTLAYLLPRLLERARGAAPPRRAGARRRATLAPGSRRAACERLLFGAVALYALQAAYSSDLAKAAENIAFFYVPFALLFLLLRDVALDARAAAALPRRGGRARGRCSRASASSSTTASRCS